MNPQKKARLGRLILTVFVLVVSVSSMYVQIQVESGNACGCVIPLYMFVPFLASLGLFIGVLVYYLISPKLEKPRLDKNIILGFLNKGESKVMSVIIENRGEIPQSRIVKLTGLPKVKVSRILEALSRRGIITKVPHKKINIIRMNDKLKGALC